MIPIKYHWFFVSYIFIVYLFDVINIFVSLYNFSQTLRWFDSPKFLKWLIIWNGGSSRDFGSSFQGKPTNFFVRVFGSVMWSISADVVWQWSRIIWGHRVMLFCVDEIKGGTIFFERQGDTIFSPRVFPMLAIVI